MLELNERSATAYLRATGKVAPDSHVAVRELAGGVSNAVFLVEQPASGERFIIKQARGKLRVADEWRCSVERIWREVEVLQCCSALLEASQSSRAPAGAPHCAIPSLLWQDAENYLYAMTAASPGSRPWKDLLLVGALESAPAIAGACGRLLGQLHAASWGDQALAEKLADRTYFRELRIDPYYRHAATRHPDRAASLENLIDSVWRNRCCLVHGDFSPKNLLAGAGELLLIDFEVGHFGDPAFDVGFFLTHLFLKAIRSPAEGAYAGLISQFWESYRATLLPRIGGNLWQELEARSLLNLAGCMLARVDGKSTVDYLTVHEQQTVRQLARGWLLSPPGSLLDAQGVLAKS